LIKNKTTIVVGAGASVDVGFPVGAELKSRIADVLGTTRRQRGHEVTFSQKNQDIYNCLHTLSDGASSRLHSLIEKSNFVANQMTKAASIDNFLDAHQSDEDIVTIGKLAISLVIAQCELASILSSGRNKPRNIAKANKYFMSELMTLLVRGHEYENLEESAENLHFIIFNYDRCVEYYAFHWLNEYFGRDCTDIFNRITFQHTYGSLGNSDGNSPSFYRDREDGPFLNAHRELPRIADGIKTFTEQKDSETLASVKSIVEKSDVLIFLGFAFEEQNMNFFPNLNSSMKHIFGTTYGFSEADQQSILNFLRQKFAIGIKNRYQPTLAPVECKELFSKYSWSLRHAIGSF